MAEQVLPLSQAENTEGQQMPDKLLQEENTDILTEASVRPKRITKLSWKSKENFEVTMEEFSVDLTHLWERTVHYMSEVTQPSQRVLQLEGTLLHFKSAYESYQRLCTKYMSFLKSTNTEESLEELKRFGYLNQERSKKVSETKANAEARITQLQDTASHHSTSTRHTKRSSRSSHSRSSTLSELIKARAEVEAAKVRATFADKKAEMEVEAACKKAEMEAEAARKKAEMEAEAACKKAEIEALDRKCEQATAEAKLRVLEQAVGSELDSVSMANSEDPMERTKNYVLNQNSNFSAASEAPDDTDTPLRHQPSEHIVTTQDLKPSSSSARQDGPSSCTLPHKSQTTKYQSVNPGFNIQTKLTSPLQVTDMLPDNISSESHPAIATNFQSVPDLNPHANPYFPRPPCADVSDLARYMVRRELTSTGLTRFDDHPENYRGWKSTFKAAINDLGIPPGEEFDMLIKWLGPQSRERVKRLKAVHVDNPSAGLRAAWERLDQSYGSPEAVEDALLKRLKDFPKISGKDNQKFQELSDLLLELQLAKADPHLPGLSYLDTAHGVNPIAAKLPYGIQEKWATMGSKYKKENQVSFPPFFYFCDFVKNIAETKNDPSFFFNEVNISSPNFAKDKFALNKPRSHRGPMSVKKTNVLPDPVANPKKGREVENTENPNRQCPIHKKPHALKNCLGFQKKPLQERKEILRKLGICFKCCASTEHLAKDCKAEIKCKYCGSNTHVQALHPLQPTSSSADSDPATNHGGENASQTADSTSIFSTCTEVCGKDLCDRSCAKICLVRVYPNGQPERAMKLYTILDDQSNHSLAKSEFFDYFRVKGNSLPYTLGTCGGVTEVSGRRANGFTIASLDGTIELPLPTLVECDQIPSHREEIPTPEAAFHHAHLKAIAEHLPPLDKNAEILLLLGRDILRVHKARQQINGSHNAPYAQRLDLGWVIIGNVCINRTKRATSISSCKTYVLPNGRETLFKPCPYHYSVKETFNSTRDWQYITSVSKSTFNHQEDCIGDTVFISTCNDDKPALAIEDKEFLKIMDKEFTQNQENSWVAPLPFRTPRERLPNNHQQAVSRFASLKRSFERKPEMKKHFVSFIQKVLENDHAEPAPPLKEGEECWYLPSFGVYHPRKPGQIRVVFDSSAQYQGVSLNNVLLTGPNLNNNLIGVLIRFRQEPIAVMADIQQMFHCFIVREQDRNYLRFLWHRNNDLNDKVIDYRMKVHVFGNSPSPAVAIYGLRRTAKEGEQEYGTDARHFVEKNFYVDDGLKSLPTEEEAIDLLRRVQEMLSVANLRLHKIISNSDKVMKAFDKDDYASNLKNLDLGSEDIPMQRSLGLLWDIKQDTFTFQVSTCDKPFTKRGVLSVVNSIYDPLGFIAPVTIRGKFLLRQLTLEKVDWDTPLPDNKLKAWKTWKNSLKALQNLQIPRCYTSISLASARRKEIHILSDASIEAIAAVAYLRLSGLDNRPAVGFLLGKTKLTPKSGHTVPRLELCAAVLAVEMAETLKSEMNTVIDSFDFYTDSKVVLGYIHNETRRFYMYVSNRVERIRKFSTPQQWHYISTDQNPADHGTRALPANELARSNWLLPPDFLCDQPESSPTDIFNLVDSEVDKEIRPEGSTLYTTIHQKKTLGSHRFQRFSTWSSIIRVIARPETPENYLSLGLQL